MAQDATKHPAPFTYSDFLHPSSFRSVHLSYSVHFSAALFLYHDTRDRSSYLTVCMFLRILSALGLRFEVTQPLAIG